MTILYLDNAASTPLDPEVAAAMQAHLGPAGANPSSAHTAGRAAAQAVAGARAEVAAAIGAEADDIIWTSGATEANNLAILGSAGFHTPRCGHIVTARTEHRSVIDPVRHLERRGWRVSWLEVDAGGRIDPAALVAALRDDTALVSIMPVNNETGVTQDLKSLAPVLRGRDITLHLDASQAVGRIALDVAALGADLLSLSAHKLHGPQGVGALYVRRRPAARLAPLLYGAGHERGLRPGTVAVHQVVGMGTAMRLATDARATETDRLGVLRERLWRGLAVLPGITRNGHASQSAPHILNVSVAGVQSESLLAALTWGEPALAVSAGSACMAGTGASSHVLRAMGRSARTAAASIRFSFGRTTTSDEVEAAAQITVARITHLRAMAPAAEPAEVPA